MNRVAPVAAVWLVLGSACGDDGVHPPPRAVEVRASGCSLVDELAVGSVVGDGLVLTVAHTLRGATGVAVDGRAGEVVAIDHRIDAALIAADVDGPTAHFATEPAPGVAVLLDAAAQVTDVVEANVEEPHDDTTHQRRALILDAPIVNGDSGAAVVGIDGSVLGMVFAASTGREGVAYAVASTELAPFVAGAGDGAVGTGDC